jgi:hypothetical protein
MNDTIRDILTAPEIIAIDQDPLGIQGTRIRNENGLQVWQKPLSDGSVAVALLNVTKSAATIDVTLEEIGFKKGVASSVRDLWKRKDLASIKDMYKTEVEAHGVLVLKIKGKKAPVSMLKFNQPSIELNKGNHKMVQLTVLPSVTPVTVTSSNENIVSIAITGVNTYKLTAIKEGICNLKAVTSNGKFSATCNIQVLPSNIPVSWKLDDIKDNKASVSYDNGAFSIEGGGRDIWGGIDQFAFLNQEAGKDAFISARIISQSNPDPWAKTGLMFRESTAPDSKFVMISITPVNGISLQWREINGGTCNKKDFQAVTLPFFFKLSRTGSTFSAYKSADETEWELLGEVNLNQTFPEKYLIGMEVCSHSSQDLNLSKFDQVMVGDADKK